VRPHQVLAAIVAVGLLAPVRVTANERAPWPVEELHAAINNHDVEGSLVLFADDGLVFHPRVGGGPDIFIGRDEIRWWMQRLSDQNARLEQVDEPVLVDGHMRWTMLLALDAYRSLAIESIETRSDAIVEGGRIQSLTIVPTPAGARRLHGGAPPAVPWRRDPNQAN